MMPVWCCPRYARFAVHIECCFVVYRLQILHLCSLTLRLRVTQFGLHVPEVAAGCFQPCIDSVVPGVLIGGCLFDSRLHGRSNAAFHSRCDGKGATIGFVFSGSSVFGFVAAQSWNVRNDLGGTSAGIEAPGCRLFSLFRDGVFDPVVFELADKGDRSAMLCSPRIGPGFGSESCCG